MPSKITTIDYRVPYADTDKMGVVYYAHYLTYFERVRNDITNNASQNNENDHREGTAKKHFPTIEWLIKPPPLKTRFALLILMCHISPSDPQVLCPAGESAKAGHPRHRDEAFRPEQYCQNNIAGTVPMIGQI